MGQVSLWDFGPIQKISQLNPRLFSKKNLFIQFYIKKIGSLLALALGR